MSVDGEVRGRRLECVPEGQKRLVREHLRQVGRLRSEDQSRARPRLGYECGIQLNAADGLKEAEPERGTRG
jgi:hypothetical protein